MQTSQSNFLEININPQQLWVLIQSLYSRLDAQEQRITQVSTQAGCLETFILSQTKKQQKVLREQFQHFRFQSKQIYDSMRNYFLDKDEKSTKKIIDLQSAVNTLNYKLQTIKTQLQDDITLKLCYLQRKANSFEGAQQKEIQQLMSRVESIKQKLSKLTQESQSSKTFQNEFQVKINKKMVLYNQEMIKIKQIFQKDSFTKKDKQTRSRHKIKTQKNINNEEILPQLKLEQTNEEVCNKDYGGLINKKEKITQDCEERRPKEMLRLLAQKIEIINQSINQNLPQIKDKLARYMVRSQIVNQQVDFLNKKLEKQRAQFNVLSQQIKLYEDKRNNQKEIQNIKNCISQLSKDLNDCLQTKLSKEVFERHQKYVIEKLSFLIENYFQKADKNEVKKGLLFLEDKLKQIVIVIAQQKNLNKDGALKKVQPKCLSCDKQLDFVNDTTKKQFRASFNLQGRVSTPHLLKKYKNAHQITMQDQN